MQFGLLLINMQFGVVGLCADILSRDMMLADESRDLLVSHVVFQLDFFAGVPFCQFWGGIVLDEIVVDASLGEAFLIPDSKDIYVLRFGNAIDGRFLDLVLLNNFINGVERIGFLWLGFAWYLFTKASQSAFNISSSPLTLFTLSFSFLT